RAVDVITHAAELDCALAWRVDCISGSWVQVARLAHRARVDQIVVVGADLEHLAFAQATGRKTLDSSAGNQKASLEVRVAEESKARVQLLAERRDVARIDQIFVFIERRAMAQIEAIDSQRPSRQVAQERGILFGELAAGPPGRRLGGVVVIL